MKYILITLAVFLTGCASMDRVVCLGTGTCVDGAMTYKTPQTPARSLPQTVILPTGTYVIVPNYSNNSISAVLQTSRTK